MVTGVPPGLDRVTVCELDWPVVTLPKMAVPGLAAKAPAVAPVPERATVWVPLLSTTERVPLSVPAVVGVKVTSMLQLAPAARLVPQLLVSAKLPEAPMLVSESAVLPPFVRVTDMAALVMLRTWLLKVSELTESVAVAVPVPVPESATVWVPTLSSTERVPLSVPVVVGVKVTEMVQLAPADRLEPQVFVSAKLPEALMPLRLRVALPLLVRVRDLEELAVFNACAAKATAEGDKTALGEDEEPVEAPPPPPHAIMAANRRTQDP